MAGHSFRFGHKNSGTPTLLSRKAEQLGIGCDIIPAVTLDGVTVSSTHIRGLLEAGDVENAAASWAGPTPSPVPSATARFLAPAGSPHHQPDSAGGAPSAAYGVYAAG